MVRSADVIIIGAGIIGTSIAYHLARRGCRDVLVLERGLVGSGATSKCNGGVRLQFSDGLNVRFSLEAMQVFEGFRDEFGVDPDFRQYGYLFLITDESDLARFRDMHTLQHSLGVPVQMLSPDDVRHLVPALEIGGILGASYCARDGFADPHAVIHAIARRALSMGVQILEGSLVIGINIEGNRVQGVRTQADTVAGRWVVNAGGPWSGMVGHLAGVDIPVQPHRRSQFITAPFDGVADPMPLVIESGVGFSFRKEGPGVLMGMTKPEPPGRFDESVDWEWLPSVVERAMRWMPALADARIARGYAGLYDLSPDRHAIVGPVAKLEGFLCCTGFSGHGFMHGLPAGRLVAEWILDGQPSLDLSPLSPERFRRGGSPPESMAW
jgi:sarcosine oxidase subunit beta